MGNFFYLVIIAIFFLQIESYSQSDGYIVKPTSFSSSLNNEFSPVFYRGGIVFCSDERDNSLVSYRDDQSRLYKIFYVTRKGSSGWNHPKIFSKELTTAFNDGPAIFNGNENIIYYSRNSAIKNLMRNISDTSNKLCIYSAELKDGIWTNIRPFTYNNPLYSFSTPAITPDGERIFFASDMPGGSGRMDLYYCDWRNNGWDKPVNMGPVINTSGNESFPFASKYGKLYFASDGHKGYGGKDLFYTQEINGAWVAPVHLDSAINSSADDFGLVIDSTSENGYFSTNRRNTDDIFSFSSKPIEFTGCDSIRENNYCFTFYDEKQRLLDTVQVIYQWDFGEGIIRIGKEVKHCFPGPGKYSVHLTITDELTGDTIAKQVDYKVDLENIKQVYINSYDVGIVDRSISFDGLITDLKGFGITDYYWNLGDGFKPGGALISKTFNKKGDYTIKLGVLGRKDSLGMIPRVCAMKKIRIFNSYQELELKAGGEGSTVNEEVDSVSKHNRTVKIRIYLMDNIGVQQRGRIEEALKKSGILTLKFDLYGIKPVSYAFLDNVIGILKENPDIFLEMSQHSFKDKIKGNSNRVPEVWTQELSFYFKNEETDMDRIHSSGIGLSGQVFEPSESASLTNDGVIDFIFMKK